MHGRINSEALARLRQRRLEMKQYEPEAMNTTSPELMRQIDGDQPSPSTTRVSNIDAEMLGTALAKIVAEKLKRMRDSLEARIAELEQELKGRKSMVFKGEFQRAVSYQEGDVVSFNEKLYCAAKDIPAGGNLRNGQEGWVFMFKGTE